MANTRTYKQSFNGGEVSPDFWGQIGDGKYQSGVATMRNFIALPHGPAQNRTGTKFIRETKTATLPVVRLIPFVYSLDQTYVIEAGENYFRFHTNGATVLFPTTGVLAWNSATNYVQGDLVTYGGFTYYAKTASLNQTPALVSAYWYRQPTTGEYEIPTPYAITDLYDIRYAQSYDVLTLCHYDTPVQELRRYGATDWRLVELDSGATIAKPTGISAVPTGTGSQAYFYKVSAIDKFGTESAASIGTSCINDLLTSGNYNTISWTGVSGAVRYNVYKDSGVYGLIGQTDSLSFKDDNIAPDLSQTIGIEVNLKTEYGYPRAVSYYEQRRAFASFSPHIAMFSNATPYPQMIVMSKPGTASDFSYSLPSMPTNSLRFNIAAREANVIQHMVPLQELIVLTNAAEWRVSSVDGGGLTPSTIQVKAQSYIGSNAVQPVVVNNNILFAANRGGHVRELAYSFAAGGYLTGDLSLRAPHLFDNYTITDMTLQKAPQQVAWFTSVSGKLLGLTYVPEQQLAAWHQHDTDGFFQSVCAVPEGNEDALYAAIVRTIGGAEKVYIERFASRQFAELEDAWFVDCGASYSGKGISSATLVITTDSTFTPAGSLTLTTSSPFFAYPAATDVGDEIWFYDDLGVKYTLAIQSTSSTTVATATVDKVIDLDEVNYTQVPVAADTLDPAKTNGTGVLSNGNLSYEWNGSGSFGSSYGSGVRSAGKHYFEITNTTASGTGPLPTRLVTLDPYKKHALSTLTNGNLTFEIGLTGVSGTAYGTVPKNSGKFYFEIVNTLASGYGGAIYDNWGFGGGISTGQRNTGNDQIPGTDATGWGFSNTNSSGLSTDSSTLHNGVATPWVGVPQVPQGGYLGVAVDLDAGKVWFNANGTWVGGGNPAAGTSPAYTFTPNTVVYPGVLSGSYGPYGIATANFGATAFAGTKPTGFFAWNVDSGITNTFDPISSNANIALTGSNKTAKSTSSALPIGQFYGAISTISHNTGKYYLEFTQDVYVTKSLEVGLVKSPADMGMPATTYLGSTADGFGVDVDWAGNLFALNSSTSSTIGVGLTANGDNIGIAVDFDAGKWWVRRNGVWTSGDPAAGTGGIVAFPITPNTTLYAAVALNGTTAQVTANFGDSAFAYTIPSGFSPWATTPAAPLTNIGFGGGVSTAARSITAGYFPGADANSWGFSNRNNTNAATSSSTWFSNTPDYVNLASVPQVPQGGYLGVAVDFDAGKMWFNANGTWVKSGNPATGANPTYTFTPNTPLYPALGQGGLAPNGKSTINFGNTAWAGTIPAGFAQWAAGGFLEYITVAGNTWDVARDSFSGLSHLEGKTVSILGDGAVFPQKVVTGGTVTLDQPACKAIIGLPITADLQTLPFAAGIDNAYGQGRQKNVNRAILRVYRSSGIFVGPTTDKLTEAKQRTTEPYGSPPELKSDEVDVVLTPSWRNSGGQIYIRQADPLPLTVVSLTTEVSLGD